MITHILDTGVCVDLSRGRLPEAMPHLRQYAPGAIAISAVTLAELELGVSRSGDPDHNSVILGHFLAPLQVLAFDERAAQFYGHVRAELMSGSIDIEPMAVLVAAQALSRNLTLVTADGREYRHVAGLRLEDWAVA